MQYAALTALVAQRIEHLTTDQKVGGSNPSERARVLVIGLLSPGLIFGLAKFCQTSWHRPGGFLAEARFPARFVY